MLVSVRRRVPDVDVDWYLRILAIADLDRKIGTASTILDTVHVPAYTADSLHEYVRRRVTTKLLSVATKTTTPGRFVQHAVHGGPVVFARADAGCRLASPAPGSSARALLLRPLLKRHQTRPAVARLPAGPGGRPAIDRAAAEGSAIRRC